MLLLDTDHISILQTQSEPSYSNLRQRMAQHSPRAFYFCIVSFHEQFLGAHEKLKQARTPDLVIRGYRRLS